jgi:hypothetical protein
LLERIIENWLNDSNERGYEIPFAQSLISSGYSVLHISSHGPYEQGKDIISIDPDGVPCAFQLKDEKITLNEWRKISGEVTDLIEIPIQHPSIDSSISHRSVLVTNKEITDPARATINSLNEGLKNRNFPPLELITGTQLLRQLIDTHGSYLPVGIEDFHLFLELVLTNGRDNLDKEKFVKFLESFVLSDINSEIEIKRMLSSLVLLIQYIFGSFEKEENHIQIVEGWTFFLNYLLYLVVNQDLSEEYWKDTFELIFEKINYQIALLKEEIFERDNFLEPGWDGGLFYRGRLGLIGGWISAYELVNLEIIEEYDIDENVVEFIEDQFDNMWFWGESSTPHFLAMSILLEKYGDESFSVNILTDMLNKLVLENNRYSGDGFPDPYLCLTDVLEIEYGVFPEEVDKSSFVGYSYHLDPIVKLFVLKCKKSILEAVWKGISYILHSMFVADTFEDFFLYRCKKGNHNEFFYEIPQSWSKLKQISKEKITSIPPILLEISHYIFYLLLIYPHRLNEDIIKILYSE